MNTEVPHFQAWMDFETDGIDEPIELLEAAVVVTDNRFNELGRFSTTIKNISGSVDMIMMNADPVVQRMHAQSGLWEEADAFGTTTVVAENFIIDCLRDSLRRVGLQLKSGSQDYVINMAGSGVERFDRGIVHRHMPRLDSLLHYASTDVSSVRNFLLQFNPEDLTDELREHIQTPVPHRALPDILHHMRTARLIRDLIAGRRVG